MKRIKVKLKGKGTYLVPFRVELPTFVIDCQRDADGQPILTSDGFQLDSVDYKKMTCYVLVPDDEVSPDGHLDEKRIRVKYKEGWSEFKAEDVEVS